MIGDTSHDIEAGKAAGLKTYAVSWGTHDEATLQRAQPTVVRNNLIDLLELLKS